MYRLAFELIRSEEKTVWQGALYGKEAKYKCKYCNAAFIKPQSLGAHVTARHTSLPEVLEYFIGARKYLAENGEKCPWGCGEMFYSSAKLLNHITTVHSEQVAEKVKELSAIRNTEGQSSEYLR